METLFEKLLPRLRKLSENLDSKTLLEKNQWLSIEPTTLFETSYIFRPNCELLVSHKGDVKNATWELLYEDKILIETDDDSTLYEFGVLQNSFLLLKKDGRQQVDIFMSPQYAKVNKIDSFLKALPGIEGEINLREMIQQYINPTIVEDLEPLAKFQKYVTKSGSFEINIKNGDVFRKGDFVFLNGKRPQDGKYKLGWMRFIVVTNGVISGFSIIK